MHKIKLFCLPFAGGSANYFLKWNNMFSEEIEIVPIELAGRGKRINESFYESFEEAVNDIYRAIVPYLNSPYAILGHSMGSTLTYELVYKIKIKEQLPPQVVFLCGSNPPDKKESSQWSAFSDETLIDTLYSLGGFPKTIINNKELMEIFLPIIRSDLNMIEKYNYRSYVLNTNIVTFNGKEDNLVSLSEVHGWGKLTNKNFDSQFFQGGHFFFENNIEQVSHYIRKYLELYSKPILGGL